MAADRRDAEAGSDRPRRRFEVVGDGRGAWWDAARRERTGAVRAEITATRLREILAEVPGGRDVVITTRAAATLDPAERPPRSASAVVSVVAPEPRTVMGDRGGRVVGDAPPRVLLRTPDSQIDFEQVEAWVEATGDPSRVGVWGVPELVGPESYRRLADLGVVLEDGAREVQENLGVDVRGLDADARDALLKWVPQYAWGGIVVDRGVSPEGIEVRAAVPLPVRAGADLPYLPRLAEGRESGTTGIVVGPRMSPAVNALLNAHRDSPARMLDDTAVEGVFARHLDPSSTTPLRQEFASGRYRAENPLAEPAVPRASEALPREALRVPQSRPVTPAPPAPEFAGAIELSELTFDGRLTDPRAVEARASDPRVGELSDARLDELRDPAAAAQREARARELRASPPVSSERARVEQVDGADVRAQARALLDEVTLPERAVDGARAMVDAALSDSNLAAELRRDPGAVQVVEFGAKAAQGARIRVRTVSVEPDAEPARRSLHDLARSAERSLSDRRVSHGRGLVFSEPLTISIPLLFVHLMIRAAGLLTGRGSDLGSVRSYRRSTSVAESGVEVDTARNRVRFALDLDLPGDPGHARREARATAEIGQRTGAEATLRDPGTERPVWSRPDDVLHAQLEGLDDLAERLRTRLDIRVGDPAADEIRSWLHEMDQSLLTGPESRTFSVVSSGPTRASRPVTVTVGPTDGVAWWSYPPREGTAEQRDIRTVETRYDRLRGRWRGLGLTVMGGVFFPGVFGLGGGPAYNRYRTTTTTNRTVGEQEVVDVRTHSGPIQRHDVRRRVFATIAPESGPPTVLEGGGVVTARLWVKPEPVPSTGTDSTRRGVDPAEITEGARARRRAGAVHLLDQDSRDLVVAHASERLAAEHGVDPDLVAGPLRRFLDTHAEEITTGRARFPMNEIVRGAPDVFVGASVGESSGRRHEIPNSTGSSTTGTGQRDESGVAYRKDTNLGPTFQGYAQGLYYVSAGATYKWGAAESSTAALLANATSTTTARPLEGWDYPASFHVGIGGSWSTPGPDGAALPGRVGVIVPAPAADPPAGDAPGTGAATARWSDTAPEPFARRGNPPLRSENETVQQAPDLTVEAARLLHRPAATGVGAVVRGVLRPLFAPFVGSRPDRIDEPHRARRFFRHDPRRDGANSKNAALEILETSTSPHAQRAIGDEAAARHRDIHLTTSGREGWFGQRADLLQLRQTRTLGNPRIVAVDEAHTFTHTVDPGVDVGREAGTHGGWRGRVGALGITWVLDHVVAGFGGDLQVQRLTTSRSTSGGRDRELQTRTHTERGFQVVYDYTDKFEGKVQERVVDPFGIDHGLPNRNHAPERWVEVPGGLTKWVPASEIHDVGVLDEASLGFLNPGESSAYRAAAPEPGTTPPDDRIPDGEAGTPGHVELHRSGVVEQFHERLGSVLDAWGAEQGASGPLKVLAMRVQDREFGPTNDPARMDALVLDLLRNGWPLLVTAASGGRSLDLLVDVRGSLGVARRFGDAPSDVTGTTRPTHTEKTGQSESRKWSVRHDGGAGAFLGDATRARPRMFAAYFVDYEATDTSVSGRSTERSSTGTDRVADRARTVRDLNLEFGVHAVARRGSVLRRLHPLLEFFGRGEPARADFTARETIERALRTTAEPATEPTQQVEGSWQARQAGPGPGLSENARIRVRPNPAVSIPRGLDPITHGPDDRPDPTVMPPAERRTLLLELSRSNTAENLRTQLGPGGRRIELNRGRYSAVTIRTDFTTVEVHGPVAGLRTGSVAETRSGSRDHGRYFAAHSYGSVELRTRPAEFDTDGDGQNESSQYTPYTSVVDSAPIHSVRTRASGVEHSTTGTDETSSQMTVLRVEAQHTLHYESRTGAADITREFAEPMTLEGNDAAVVDLVGERPVPPNRERDRIAPIEEAPENTEPPAGDTGRDAGTDLDSPPTPPPAPRTQTPEPSPLEPATRQATPPLLDGPSGTDRTPADDPAPDLSHNVRADLRISTPVHDDSTGTDLAGTNFAGTDVPVTDAPRSGSLTVSAAPSWTELGGPHETAAPSPDGPAHLWSVETAKDPVRVAPETPEALADLQRRSVMGGHLTWVPELESWILDDDLVQRLPEAQAELRMRGLAAESAPILGRPVVASVDVDHAPVSVRDTPGAAARSGSDPDSIEHSPERGYPVPEDEFDPESNDYRTVEHTTAGSRIPSLSDDVRAELRTGILTSLPGTDLPEGPAFDRLVQELRDETHTAYQRNRAVSEPDRWPRWEIAPVSGDAIGRGEAADLVRDLVQALLARDGRTPGVALTGGALGPELEVADVRLTGKTVVAGRHVRLETDLLEDGQRIAEIVASPMAALRGEQSRPPPHQVWSEIDRLLRRLRDARPGASIRSIFGTEAGFSVREGHVEQIRRDELPVRAIGEHVTVGSSVFGLGRHLREAYDDALREGVPTDEFAMRANRDARAFGQEVGERFLIAVAGPDARSRLAADPALRADLDAVEGHTALAYTQLLPGLRKSAPQQTIEKNLTLVLSRVPISAVRGGLPGRVRRFMDENSAGLTTLFEETIAANGPRTGIDTAGPLLDQRLGRGRSPFTGRHFVSQTWSPVPAGEVVVPPNAMVLWMHSELDRLDTADDGRPALPLVPLEHRYFRTVSGGDGIARAYVRQLRWQDISRRIDDDAWVAMAESAVAERGPEFVATLPPPARRPEGVLLSDEPFPDPARVGFAEHGDTPVDGRWARTVDTFARDALDRAVDLADSEVPELVLRVEGGGNGGLRSRAGAVARGDERAGIVADELERRIAELRTERAAANPIPIRVERSSRGSGSGASPLPEPRNSGERREVRLWADAVRRGHTAPAPRDPEISEAALDAAVLRPTVAALLERMSLDDGRRVAPPDAGEVLRTIEETYRFRRRPSTRTAFAQEIARQLHDHANTGPAGRRWWDEPPAVLDEFQRMAVISEMRRQRLPSSRELADSLYESYRSNRRDRYPNRPVPTQSAPFAVDVVAIGRLGHVPEPTGFGRTPEAASGLNDPGPSTRPAPRPELQPGQVLVSRTTAAERWTGSVAPRSFGRDDTFVLDHDLTEGSPARGTTVTVEVPAGVPVVVRGSSTGPRTVLPAGSVLQVLDEGGAGRPPVVGAVHRPDPADDLAESLRTRALTGPGGAPAVRPMLGPDLFGLLSPPAAPGFLRGLDQDTIPAESLGSFFAAVDLAAPEAPTAPLRTADLTGDTPVIREDWDRFEEAETWAELGARGESETPRLLHFIWFGSPASPHRGPSQGFMAGLTRSRAAFDGPAVLWTDLTREQIAAVRRDPGAADPALAEMLDRTAEIRVRLASIDELFHRDAPMLELDAEFRSEMLRGTKGGWAKASDIARMEILHRFGGLYLDGDDILSDADAAFGSGVLDGHAGGRYSNSHLLAARHHPVVRERLRVVAEQYDRTQIEIVPSELEGDEPVRRMSVLYRASPGASPRSPACPAS
ncbi:hypothetical protein [Pseudonocardia sp. ICBG1293]|uniref:hypothetical protein n=1 Tax=Pseudonocardia sp. ICBG1293 TaxID=2844382 RepID=UPI001CCBE9A2|nr:hypothetical protein [Pseudonocardia sp. ICBG1293]